MPGLLVIHKRVLQGKKNLLRKIFIATKCRVRGSFYSTNIMKINEIYTSVNDRRQGQVYNNFKLAYRQAERTGKKVTWSPGGYYKVVSRDDPGPELEYNTNRPEQIERIQDHIKFLEQGLEAYRKDRDLFKRVYYRKYGLPKKISSRIAQLRRDIEDLPYAVEKVPAE